MVKRISLLLILIMGLVQVQAIETKSSEDNVDKKHIVEKAPDVESDKIIEAIVAKHKGKVVLVDLWATWCGPCLNGMKKMKDIKPQMAEKDVVIVYITDTSSPESDWNGMLSDIGGIHYRLDKKQFNALKGKYEFRGIPTYIVFDKEGNKAYQRSGYPGNEMFIEELSKIW